MNTLHFSGVVQSEMQAGRLIFAGVKNDGGDGGGGGVVFHNVVFFSCLLLFLVQRYGFFLIYQIFFNFFSFFLHTYIYTPKKTRKNSRAGLAFLIWFIYCDRLNFQYLQGLFLLSVSFVCRYFAGVKIGPGRASPASIGTACKTTGPAGFDRWTGQARAGRAGGPEGGRPGGTGSAHREFLDPA